MLYAGSLIGLSATWYDDFEREPFHTFDDSRDWLFVDKAGHIVTSYQVGRVGYDLLRWSGVDEKNSIWYGGPLGMVFLTTVEVFDGYSSGWGFSWADMAANAAGTALFMGQQAGWGEQKLSLKFSYHRTDYADLRPELLGSDPSERILKDYNGQTLWLSVNLKSVFKESRWLPDWLMLSGGYGADGLLGGRSNPAFNDAGMELPDYRRESQFYLSFDIDLYKVDTGIAPLNTLLRTFGFLKIPAPTLELTGGNDLKFYPLYF